MLVRHGSRYISVAAFCFSFNNILLVVLDRQGMSLFWCLLVSVIVMIPLSYLLHARFTFDQKHSQSNFIRFAVVQLLNFPAALLLLYVINGQLELSMPIAAPLTTTVMFCWNFVSARWALKFDKQN